MKELVYAIMILFVLFACTQSISVLQKMDITQTEVESIAPAINKSTNDCYYTKRV